MAPKALSAFGKAFSEARAQGLKTFEFRGSLYTTETAEEQLEGAAGPEGGVNRSPLVSPVPGGAQQSMQQSPAGQVIGAGARQVPSLMEGIKANAASILSGAESEIGANIPQFAQVKEAFSGADKAAKAAGMDLTERDVERHKTGSRNASLDAGFFTTLLGSQGHEANTVAGTVRQMMSGKPFDETSITGQALTPGRYAAESIQDSINNLFGQAEAILIQLGVGSREQPPQVGSVSIDRPGTKMAGVGSSVESGVNALADLVSLFQQKLAEVRSNDAESQVAAVQGTGREARI